MLEPDNFLDKDTRWKDAVNIKLSRFLIMFKHIKLISHTRTENEKNS